MVIVLIGPSGCGKTIVGALLAKRLRWLFFDADDFHPAANVEKMRNGIPLTDEDRQPWLERLRDEINSCLLQERDAVLACSALKKNYRQTLGIDQVSVKSVYLKGSCELIKGRMEKRRHQYMNNALLKSQIETFEEPEGGLTADISPAPEKIVQIIIDSMGLSSPSPGDLNNLTGR
ncbi:MAG: AAA family ATPase [Deltaproteobacteria bacterium]|nr:AAA family ATPase [Deltaproteobacteria bacterium]